MKIKLISPRMSLRPMDSEFKRVMSPSLALMTIASVTPDKHQVSIDDENAGRVEFGDTPDCVGITVNVDTSRRAYEIAQLYKKRNIPVIMGGIHASAKHDEALEHADCVCVGEAEGIWSSVLDDLERGSLKKIYYDDKPVDMASIPFPRRDLLDNSKYLYPNIITASRGCPYQCEFCYNSCDYVHQKYRNKPVDKLVEEIKSLKTKQIMFIDDNLIGNVSWVKEFLRAIKPLGLTWHAAASSNLIDNEGLIEDMRASGCSSLFVGFESINNDSIKSVNKHQNQVHKYEALIRKLHECGIMVNASMVFGFDHDSSGTFASTLKWLVSNKVETVTAHILTPYPGTKLFSKLESEGRISEYDWSLYNTSNVVYEPKNMNAQELLDGYLWLYKEFYSVKNIIRRIPDAYRNRIPYLLFNLGYRKFGKITSKIGRYGLMNNIAVLARRLSYGIG